MVVLGVVSLVHNAPLPLGGMGGVNGFGIVWIVA